MNIVIVTSIHPDFDARIWKHATGLVEKGLNVTLVCPWDVDSGSVVGGVKLLTFQRVRRRWQRPIIIPIKVLLRLTRVLKSTDIIHFHDIDLLPWMSVLSLFKSVVYDVHENYSDEMLVRNWIPKMFRRPLSVSVLYAERIFSGIIKNVVLVTSAQKSTFRSNKLNILLLYNYASLALRDHIVANYSIRPNAVIFLGSQYPENGSLLYLDIVEQASRKGIPVKFYAVDRFGSEKLRSQYLEAIANKEIGEWIELLPNLRPDKIMDYLNKATIAINPVLRVKKQLNAINTKLFEFMAAGLPIISSDLPYIKEIFEKSRCGILAQPEASSTFVDQIEYLANNKKLANEMSQSGVSSFITSYSWESQVDDLVKYYRNILNGN